MADKHTAFESYKHTQGGDLRWVCALSVGGTNQQVRKRGRKKGWHCVAAVPINPVSPPSQPSSPVGG
jgi:hypothetical protein